MIALLEQTTARPPLPSDDELAAAKTELRLEVREPKTRALLVYAADHRRDLASDWARRLRIARDDLAAWITSNAGGLGKSRKRLDAILARADRLLAVEPHADTLATLDPTADPGDGAAAMDALIRASKALDALVGAAAKAKDLSRDLAPPRRKSIVPKALRGSATPLVAVRDSADELAVWATRKRIKSADVIATSVARHRPGGKLDRGHGKDYHPGPETEGRSGWTTAGASLEWTWKMMSISHLLGSQLLEKVKRDLSTEDLTADIKVPVERALLARRDGDSIDGDIEDAVQAIAAHWPDATAIELEETRAHLGQLIHRVVGAPMTADEVTAFRVRVDAALADRDTDGIARDILNAGATWPLGTAHYLRRLEERMDASYGIADILTWFRDGLVRYLLMGQMSITINREVVDALALAEKHYFAWRKQIPGAGFVVATDGTGAYNFRAHSKGKRLLVLQKLWLKKGDGRLVHISGRAIDINYPDRRNPRFNEAEKWAVIRAVLRYAGATELAAIDFTRSGKDFDTLSRILDASEVYKSRYAAWKQGLPGSLLLPQTTLPTARAYAKALRAAGHHKKARAVVAARRELGDRKEAEAAARTAYLRRHARLPEIAADAIDDVLARVDDLPQMERLRIAIDARVWGALVTARAALRRWQKAAKLAKKQKGRTSSGLRRQSESARTAVEEARDLVAARLTRSGSRTRTAWLTRVHEVLPGATEWDAIDEVTGKYARARARTDDAAAAQPLVDLARGESEVKVIRVYSSYRRDFDAWGRSGFADHEHLFMWSMVRAGWCWGAEFSEPDMHHYQYIPGRYCKADAGDEP